MTHRFDDVQRIVMRGTRWRHARHLLIDFNGKRALHFLSELLNEHRPATHGCTHRPALQVSLGFTRSGLEAADVPDPVLACFALKSPAYWAGAAVRATRELALTGESAVEEWAWVPEPRCLHAVLSLHSDDPAALVGEMDAVDAMVEAARFRCAGWLVADAIETRPEGVQALGEAPAQWVHFGYRDGLSRIEMKGLREARGPAPDATSLHEPGEFVLGHRQDSGANPWLGGPGLQVWPKKLRRFFHNGSFGVLHQVSQHAADFEAFVTDEMARRRVDRATIKGALCGRYPDGRSLLMPNENDLRTDFNYAEDPAGARCPFGSHVRRMNPRVPLAFADARSGVPTSEEATLARYPAHFSRRRPLLRRGLPYGPPIWRQGQDPTADRGLMGQFFCASIEDQYELLLGEWADRVPIGSPDAGRARDPLIGAHARGDGAFVAAGLNPSIKMTQPFVHTKGIAYLFYPSLSTLEGIAESGLWGLDDRGDECPCG